MTPVPQPRFLQEEAVSVAERVQVQVEHQVGDRIGSRVDAGDGLVRRQRLRLGVERDLNRVVGTRRGDAFPEAYPAESGFTPREPAAEATSAEYVAPAKSVMT